MKTIVSILFVSFLCSFAQNRLWSQEGTPEKPVGHQIVFWEKYGFDFSTHPMIGNQDLNLLEQEFPLNQKTRLAERIKLSLSSAVLDMTLEEREQYELQLEQKKVLNPLPEPMQATPMLNVIGAYQLIRSLFASN